MVNSNHTPNNEDEIERSKPENSPEQLKDLNLELQLQLEQEKAKNQQLTVDLLTTQQKLTDLEIEFERQLERKLNQQIIELELCYNLSRQIGSTVSYEDLFRSMLQHLYTVVPCDIAGGILIDNLCELFLNANRPLSTVAQIEIQQRLLDSIVKVNGSDLLNRPLCLHNLNYQLQSSETVPIQSIGSHFFVPIIADPEAEKQIVGLLFVGTEKSQQFTENHIRMLYRIANQASTYVQQLRMLLEAEKNRLETEKIRQALAREKEINELRNRIVRTISHEYRTPLTIISLAINLLESQDEKLTQNQRKNCFSKIRTATEYIANLVEDVLLVNQVESEEVIFLPQKVNPVELCSQLIKDFQIIAGQNFQILFNTQGYSKKQIIYLDRKLVRQILNNLLSNAIKYSPDGGTINLNLICESERIIFQVGDRGMGIPPEDINSLFECFHRGSNVGTLPGSGLGLAIVKKYVEIHRGEICFETKLNVGTTFTITLPIIKPD